jgi:hypothetical protein
MFYTVFLYYVYTSLYYTQILEPCGYVTYIYKRLDNKKYVGVQKFCAPL